MEQLRRFWSGLSLRQKVTLALAPLVALALLTALVRWNRERNFRPLFFGLAPEEAGQIVALLQQSNTPYRLADGGSTILVPSERVAEARLRLAASGLPQTGRIGFELFDQNRYGVTEFAERIQYHRALEGELERSVASLVEVERARVHITLPKDSVFVEERQPAKASVLVKLRPGARLSPENVRAIRHLVASAVQGLEPSQVSVMDMYGRLLGEPAPSNEEAQLSATQLEYRRKVEEHLLAKVRSTLEPLLGPENFRAAVSVECDFSTGEESEEVYDPARSVMTRSERTEDTTAGPVTAGIPGTASNLPRPPSSPATAHSTHTRRTESISYASSRTVRRTRLPQGTIKRISASVLVDYEPRREGQGDQLKVAYVPPPPEKLQVIRQLVTAALGLDEQRGDRLVVESLPFEREPVPGAPGEEGPARRPRLPVSLPPAVAKFLEQHRWVLGVALAVVALLAVLVVLASRWWRRRRRLQAELVQQALPGGGGRGELEPGTALPEELQGQLAQRSEERARIEGEILQQLKEKPVKAKKSEVLARLVAEATKQDPAATAQVIRTWLEEGTT